MGKPATALPPGELAFSVRDLLHHRGGKSLGDFGFLKFRERRLGACFAGFHIGHCHLAPCYGCPSSSPSRWRAENKRDFTVFSGTPIVSPISS